MFEIPPEPLEVISNSGETITFHPPTSWVGLAPVNAHLLSYMLRDGQVWYGIYIYIYIYIHICMYMYIFFLIFSILY